MIGAGVSEPMLLVDTESKCKIEPLKKVHEYLSSSWGNSLTKNIKNEYEIEYFGKNYSNRTDLAIEIKKEKDGTYSAEGYTFTKEQRKG